ncbi:hypothetical protein PVAP13_7KG268510 [Panicum virgatum]|uniref:Uncharacterized protein n=1 Tax=Panicum virgatum TaxID=38727 RepID=A0A8T0QHP4_PANVG|nr:hypothetical protein PVAP13_7KG268510 [Panicum virgatum]
MEGIPGEPERCPSRVTACAGRTVATREAERDLELHSLVAVQLDARQRLTCDQVHHDLVRQLRIPGFALGVTMLKTATFLLRFGQPAQRNAVLGRGPLVAGSTRLHIMPWTRQFGAVSSSMLNFRVHVCIEVIPSHTTDVETISKLFSSRTIVDRVDQELRKEEDTACVCVWVTTSDPDSIAHNEFFIRLGNMEPPEVHPGPARMLDYEVILHVDEVIDFTPLPVSPSWRSYESETSGIPDDSLDDEWPVKHRFSWQLGVPDRGQSPPRVPVHDRLGAGRRDRSPDRGLGGGRGQMQFPPPPHTAFRDEALGTLSNAHEKEANAGLKGVQEFEQELCDAFGAAKGQQCLESSFRADPMGVELLGQTSGLLTIHVQPTVGEVFERPEELLNDVLVEGGKPGLFQAGDDKDYFVLPDGPEDGPAVSDELTRGLVMDCLTTAREIFPVSDATGDMGNGVLLRQDGQQQITVAGESNDATKYLFTKPVDNPLLATPRLIERESNLQTKRRSTRLAKRPNSDLPVEQQATALLMKKCEQEKVEFLAEVRSIRTTVGDKWLLLGDFNLILHATDKSNENLNRRLMAEFRNTVNFLQMKELSLRGRRFTWSNDTTQTRIDRAFCSHRQLSNAEILLRRDLKSRLLGLTAVEKLRLKQKSRLTYIKASEANSKLFYLHANGRRKKNFIRFYTMLSVCINISTTDWANFRAEVSLLTGKPCSCKEDNCNILTSLSQKMKSELWLTTLRQIKHRALMAS